MQDFLNPKSMMTPAIAAATMMFIVNGLGMAFPEFPSRITALVISFLIGSIVFISQSPAMTAIWAKGVYWVLNSLIIFAIGFTSNNYVTEAQAQQQGQSSKSEKTTNFTDWLIAPVYADEQPNTAKPGSGPPPQKKQKEDVNAQLKMEREKNQELMQRLKALEDTQRPQTNQKPTSGKAIEKENPQSQEVRFFRKW